MRDILKDYMICSGLVGIELATALGDNVNDESWMASLQTVNGILSYWDSDSTKEYQVTKTFVGLVSHQICGFFLGLPASVLFDINDSIIQSDIRRVGSCNKPSLQPYDFVSPLFARRLYLA